MDFHTYTTTRDACKRSGAIEDPEEFYRAAFDGAVQMDSAQFYGQLNVEREWEQAKKPYYSVWPSIVPMLAKLNLALDSGLIQLPMPALCIRLPKDKNPLSFDWKGEQVQIQCMLMGEINEGRGLSILMDIGEMVSDGDGFAMPIYTYRNFRRETGLTVEDALQEIGSNELAEPGVQIPTGVIGDCVRLCCTLCLLEDDPSIIEPDVLSKDRAKFEGSGDQKYIDKAHRRGKVGWNVGRHIEVSPHYRRPHMTLVWTGRGRAVPKIVPRRGTIVHREKVENVPSGFGE
jgi:hypothetical protein